MILKEVARFSDYELIFSSNFWVFMMFAIQGEKFQRSGILVVQRGIMEI